MVSDAILVEELGGGTTKIIENVSGILNFRIDSTSNMSFGRYFPKLFTSKFREKIQVITVVNEIFKFDIEMQITNTRGFLMTTSYKRCYKLIPTSILF